MNSVSVNVHGYCSKLVNIYNYAQTDYVIFKQNCVNFILFSIIHRLMWMLLSIINTTNCHKFIKVKILVPHRL